MIRPIRKSTVERIADLVSLAHLHSPRADLGAYLQIGEGVSASEAAFEVDYEAVLQFTREYGRVLAQFRLGQVGGRREAIA